MSHCWMSQSHAKSLDVCFLAIVKKWDWNREMDEEEKIVNEEVPSDVPMAMSGFWGYLVPN